MFRTLLLKEWKQLRALRWVGLGLGAMVLFVGLSAPSAARQGWLPFIEMSRPYTLHEILIGAMPAVLALGLWPLISLLVSVQAFAGDRAAGTESFLLERPVPRSRAWVARWAAATGSALVVAVGHLLMWWGLVTLTVSLANGDFDRPVLILFGAGPAALVCCLLAGMMAASLVTSPLAALLIAVILVAIPLQLAAALTGAFPLAAYRGVTVGPLSSILFLLAYPLASYLALCRGEPAGRGRIKRGVVTLAVALVVGVGMFAVTATAAVRLTARALTHGGHILASNTGTFVGADVGGWIVDADTAESQRFIAGPIWRSAWNSDGTRLAVITFTGALGRQTAMERLRLFDAEGRSVGEFELREDDFVNSIRWVGDRLLLTMMSRVGPSRMLIYSPETGDRKSIPIALDSWSWSLVGPIDDGRVFLAYDDLAEERPEEENEGEGEDGPRRGVSYGVFEIDLERGTLASEPLVRDHGVIWYLRYPRLSPSGRYWILDYGHRERPGVVVLDTTTGEETVFNAVYHTPRWVTGDRLAWVETTDEATRVFVARPGEEPRELRAWSDLSVSLEASPDGAMLLATVSDVLEEQRLAAFPDVSLPTRSKIEEVAAYELATDRWIELATWPDEPFDGNAYRIEWANARTISRTGPGVLAFESLDAPGELRAFLGSP